VYQVTLSPKEKEKTRVCAHISYRTFLAGMNGKAPVSRKSLGVRVDLVFAQPLPGIGGAYGGSKGGGRIS
jgi:hypothetical protein